MPQSGEPLGGEEREAPVSAGAFGSVPADSAGFGNGAASGLRISTERAALVFPLRVLLSGLAGGVRLPTLFRLCRSLSHLPMGLF